MFDNKNHYSLRTNVVEGIAHYYVSFIDGQANHNEIEVSRPVYFEFLRFVKVERNLRRWDERHTEQSDLTDETLNKRALYPQKSAEDIAFDCLHSEQVRIVIQQLPEIQRRRFVLHHGFRLTYEQIAKMEGCKKQSVCESVLIAESKVKSFFAALTKNL